MWTKKLICLTAFALITAIDSTGWAQFRDRGSRDSGRFGDRGSSRFGGDSRSRFGGDRGSSRGGFDFTSMIRRMDANRDGYLQQSEMSGRMASFVERMAERRGLDMRKPIPIDKLTGSSSGSSRNSSSGNGEEPLVPGFDIEQDLELPPGFDVPVDRSWGTVVDLEKKYGSRITSYADSLMRRYDRNKDKYLDAEEMRTVRWSSDPYGFDANKDKRLSKAELCEYVSQRFSSRGRSSSRSSSSSSSSRRSYSRDGRSYSRDGRSYSRDGRSYSRDGRSYSRDGRSYSRDGRSYSRDGRSSRDRGFSSRDR